MIRQALRNSRGAIAASAALALFSINVLAADTAPVSGAFEVDVGYNAFADRTTGETSIVVDPKAANHLVMVLMSSTESFHSPAHTIHDYVTVPRNLLCGVAQSFDRGRSWKLSELEVPIGPIPTTKSPMPDGALCFDPSLVVDPQGTFYVIANVVSPYDFGTRGLYHSRDKEFTGVFRSTDGGRSWTLHEAMGKTSVGDKWIGTGKPWPAMDATTGILYVLTGGNLLTVSSDHGETFSTPVQEPWLSSGPLDVALSAAEGQMALAYIKKKVGIEERSVTGDTSGQCPCQVTVAITGDEGRTFTQHDVPMPGGPARIGYIEVPNTIPHVNVAADPTHKGRFAVAHSNPDHTQLLVQVTNDAGTTWSEPARLVSDANSINRYWIAYGPQGMLGVMWRINYNEPPQKSNLSSAYLPAWPIPGPQDVFATVARKGDTNFAMPVKVNGARSPYIVAKPSYAGDDYSSIAVGPGEIHVTWGDYRDVDRSAWYGQVPLTAFHGSAMTGK
jgi:hypothetical protein